MLGKYIKNSFSLKKPQKKFALRATPVPRTNSTQAPALKNNISGGQGMDMICRFGIAV